MKSDRRRPASVPRAKYLGPAPKRQPEEISSVIGSIIENTAVDVDLRHAQLMDEWGSLAPGDWRFGQPVGVKEGTLLVTVPDGATASLLAYQHKPLLDAIERRLGAGAVASVRVSVDRTGSAGSPR